MIEQFIILGIYSRNDDKYPFPVLYDVYVDGRKVQTCLKRGTALLRLAEEIDRMIGT